MQEQSLSEYYKEICDAIKTEVKGMKEVMTFDFEALSDLINQAKRVQHQIIAWEDLVDAE